MRPLCRVTFVSYFPASAGVHASVDVLVSGSEDGTLRLWSYGVQCRCEAVLEGHTGKVTCVAHSVLSGGNAAIVSGSEVRSTVHRHRRARTIHTHAPGSCARDEART